MYQSTLADLKIVGISSNGKRMCATVEHDPPEGDKIEGTHLIPLMIEANAGLLGIDPDALPDALVPLAA